MKVFFEFFNFTRSGSVSFKRKIYNFIYYFKIRKKDIYLNKNRKILKKKINYFINFLNKNKFLLLINKCSISFSDYFFLV